MRALIVSPEFPIPVLPLPTAPDVVAPGEDLVQVRSGPWRMYLPMRFVERVLGAALPAATPSAEGGAAPLLSIEGALVPVLFADALLGAEEVRVAAGDQMVLLGHGARRAILWVDAVEDVVPFVPVAPPLGAAPDSLVAAYGGAERRPLAVLDVPRLLELSA